MIVIHCAETLQGGVATYLNELLRVRGSHLKYWVVTPLDQRDFLTSSPDRLITYEPSSSRIMSALRLARTVNKVIKNKHISDKCILHVHSSFAGLGVRIFSSMPSSNIIYCPHGWAFDQKVSFVLRVCYRWAEILLSRRCRFVVCISQHEYRAAQRSKIQEEKLVLIRNGIGDSDDAVDSKKGTEGPDTAPVVRSNKEKQIVFAGRMDAQKGVDILKSLPLLLPKEHFIYIGSPVLGEKLQEWPENVEYLGWMPTNVVRSYMREADIVIIPSLWEGFGLVAIEAMQQRTAVFASNVGALKEIVIDGITGRLIYDYESEEAFAAAILDTKKDSLAIMGNAGYQRQQQYFTAKQLVKELEQLYVAIDK